MAFGELASEVGLARGDRRDQRLVLGDHRRRLRLAHGQPDEIADRRPQLHLLAHQTRGLRRRGDLDVDARVGAAAVGQRGRGAQALEVLAQGLDLALERALRGEPGARSGDRAAVVADVAQLVQRAVAQRELEARAVLLARGAHERSAAAAAAGLHEPERAQRGEAVAQRADRDAELAGEVGLGRQALAVEQQPEGDRVDQPLRDRLGAPAVERHEERARAHGRDRRRRHVCLTGPRCCARETCSLVC